MKKRLICLLLALAMLLTIAPMAMAEEENQLLGCSLTVNEDGGYNKSDNTTPLAAPVNTRLLLALYYGKSDNYSRVTGVEVQSGGTAHVTFTQLDGGPNFFAIETGDAVGAVALTLTLDGGTEFEKTVETTFTISTAETLLGFEMIQDESGNWVKKTDSDMPYPVQVTEGTTTYWSLKYGEVSTTYSDVTGVVTEPGCATEIALVESNARIFKITATEAENVYMTLLFQDGSQATTTMTVEEASIGNVAEFTYDGETYYVVMGFVQQADMLQAFVEGGFGINFGPNETRVSEHKIAIGIFQNVYEANMTERKALISQISDVTFSLPDCETMSIGTVVQPQETVTNTEDAYWWVPMFFSPGNENSALSAAVTLTTGEVLNIRVECHTSVRQESTIDCQDPTTFPATYLFFNDTATTEIYTMAELNELVQGLKLSADESVLTTVLLAPVIYEGVLEISNENENSNNCNLIIQGTTRWYEDEGRGEMTTILGGIRVKQRMRSIQDVYLMAHSEDAYNVLDANGNACGILTDGGEAYVAINCTFDGYEIGLADQDGYICPLTDCVFLNCSVGVQITDQAYGNGNSQIMRALFQGCGVGIQIDALPEYMTNYSFRVWECDFVDNGADLSCSSTSGYYYCYGNFYGYTQGDNVMFRNAAVVMPNILTDPRRTQPVGVEGQYEAIGANAGMMLLSLEAVPMLLSDEVEIDTTNYCTVEESNDDAVVVDVVKLLFDETGNYVINDPQAFVNRTKPLQIDLIDYNADGEIVVVASWYFAAAADATGINIGLTTAEADGKLTVTVTDAGGLGALQATLTVSCPESWLTAKATGPDGDVQENLVCEDGQVTFTVDQGGAYVLEAVTVEEEEETPEEPVIPEEPVVPEEPVKPVKPVKPTTSNQKDEEEQTTVLPFSDVKKTDWFYDEVRYVFTEGLMSGVGGGKFAPNATLTRAMVVQVLYNLEGQPKAGRAPFTDVDAGTWYHDAVAWAAENDVVNGMGDGTFAPDAPITREQLAAILYRYAIYDGMTAVTLEENLSAYPDADQVSEYAVTAMNWAVGQGLIQGMAGKLAPQATATRAQTAAILMRFCQR